MSLEFTNVLSMCDLFPSFASSTHRGWPTLAVYGKMNSTGEGSRHKSRTISTPSLQFSSSPMVPCRTSLSVLNMHSPPYPMGSRNPWPATSPSYSPMYRLPSIGTSLRIPSPIFSKTLHISSSTTPSRSSRSGEDSDITKI